LTGWFVSVKSLREMQSKTSTSFLRTDDVEISAGAVIDQRYLVISRLGDGLCGRVVKAHDQRTGEIVALKLFRPEIRKNVTTLARFRREAEILRSLQHDHIIRLRDAVFDRNPPYLVVDFIPGGSLADRIEIDRARESIELWSRQVAAALDYAHARGVIHRDLKPSNILIDGRENAVVGDFGLAKLLDDAAAITLAGTTLGSLGYAAPEQILGRDIDPSVDQYALAAIMYEVVCRCPPFPGRLSWSGLLAVVNAVPVSPDRLVPGLPPGFSAAILRALSVDPRQRFPSVTAMVSAAWG
jgi:serine/threonine protein kinase